MKNKLKEIFKPKLELAKGTRFISFFFIAFSVMIAAGILFAANMYYNIDTGEVVMEEIQRVTQVVRATAGIIIGGTAGQDPESGVGLEIASNDVLLSAENQVLKFSGGISGYHVGFQADTSATSGQSITYTLPAATPSASNFVLTSDTDGNLVWDSVEGVGGITAVGDVTAGSAAFTADGTAGTSLWFYSAPYRGQLTRATLTDNRTYTLPDASGSIALGTGTADQIAYWTDENTLGSMATLSNQMGGTGQDSSSWNGMVRVVGGTWDAVTGTTGYAAYWSDNNTIAAEQYLSVSRGGTGVGTLTSNGILYGAGTGAIQATAVGTSNQILLGSGAAPNWGNISDLLIQGNNISLSGTTQVTIATVNDPTFSMSVTSPQFLSTTTLLLQSGDGQDITIDSSSGRIVLGAGNWIETDSGYRIGESGTEILREMIPIFGFDLPVQTATNTHIAISRIINNYPFEDAATGTTRVHKFAIRYAAAGSGQSDWRVYRTSGTPGVVDTFSLDGTGETDFSQASGEAVIEVATIPTGDSWRLEVDPNGDTIRIFQIFLAAYDVID